MFIRFGLVTYTSIRKNISQINCHGAPARPAAYASSTKEYFTLLNALDVSELNLHYPIIVSQLSKLEIRTGHS
jgi:hypothetical protein